VQKIWQVDSVVGAGGVAINMAGDGLHASGGYRGDHPTASMDPPLHKKH